MNCSDVHWRQILRVDKHVSRLELNKNIFRIKILAFKMAFIADTCTSIYLFCSALLNTKQIAAD